MNVDQLAGKWDELKGKVKEKWGKFTNDDITFIQGKKDQLIGKLRERYGYTTDQANKELGGFMQDCTSCCDTQPKPKHQPSA